MNLLTKQKQTHGHRKQIYGYQKENSKTERKLGIWDEQIQTIIYNTGKQQGPTVQQKELYIQYLIYNIL